MRPSDRNIRSIIIFFIIVILSSIFFIRSFIDSDMNDFQDIRTRDSLAGELDMLIVGSCQDKYAFVPRIIDEDTGHNSYNLSGIHMSLDGEIAILSEEIDRNPLDYVIVGVDYDSLSYSSKGVKALGELTLIPRLDPASKRLGYFFKHVHLEDYGVIYSRYIMYSSIYWKSKLLGQYQPADGLVEKGHYSYPSIDLTIDSTQTAGCRQSISLDTDIIENNDDKLNKLIKMCRDRGIGVIMVMTPASDNYVWTYSGWDTVNEQFKEIAEENDVIYLDFNLYKDKSVLLHDSDSYEKLWHLSDTGSEIFTEEFCKVFNMVTAGEDVNDLFYTSYEEALLHSPYAGAK